MDRAEALTRVRAHEADLRGGFRRITEAVNQIGPTDMAQIASDLPENDIRFGNRLRHDYRNIDPSVLLRTAQKSLPPLRAAAARALER